MKRMSIITGALCGLMVLLAAVGSLLGAVRAVATDARLYGEQSRAVVAQTLEDASEDAVTAYIGLNAAQQDGVAAELSQYMAGGETGLSFLNERERQHMADVRGMVTAIGSVSRMCLSLAAALAVAAAWTGARLRRRMLPRAIGVLAAVGLVALAVAGAALVIGSVGFEAAFVRLHELLFDNDLWLLDPQTDILIRMMPQPLFEQALLRVVSRALRTFALVWAMLLAVEWTVSGMIRRHLDKGEEA